MTQIVELLLKSVCHYAGHVLVAKGIVKYTNRNIDVRKVVKISGNKKKYNARNESC